MNDNKDLNISIYRAISPSGKSYIGISKDLEARKKQHIRAAFNINDPYRNDNFKQAIRKYGPENIK